MRILFVCCEEPDAPRSGSVAQTYHFMQHLSATNELGVLVPKHRANPERVAALRRNLPCVWEADVRAETAVERRWRWMISGDPMARWSFSGSKLMREVSRAIREFQPDIVQFEQLHVAYPLLQLAALPNRPRLVLNAHDCLYVLLKRALETESAVSRVRTLIEGHFVRRIRSLERLLVRAADLTLCVSETDAAFLGCKESGRSYAITPNGVDANYFARTPVPLTNQPKLLFIGSPKYGPNRQAIAWFLDHVYPALLAKYPGVTFTVMGEAGGECAEYRAVRGVCFAGHQTDPRPLLDQATITIVPLLAGSGTRFKILESWAAGRPVVSTTVGAEGLAYRDGRDILIADSPRDFMQAIIRLHESPALARNLAENGRKLAVDQYSWPVITAQLTAALEGLFPASALAVSA